MIFDLNITQAAKDVKPESNSALVVFVNDDNKQQELEKVKETYSVKFNRLLEKGFTEKDNGEIRQYNAEGEPDLVIVKKIKLSKKFTPDFFRDYIAGLVQSLEKENIENLYIQVPESGAYESRFGNAENYFVSFIDGLYLGNYNYGKYKSETKEPVPLNVYIASDESSYERIIKDASLLFEGVDFARDLSNEPAIDLTPMELARKTKEELKPLGVDVTIFDRDELERRKMYAILAVGDSSANKPALINLHYKPDNPLKKIALVGKGITYDSGGLSIKPTSGMMDMKGDMSGAASVIGIIKAAALLRLPVEILGFVSAAENMISGSSYKPGDVVRTYSGKTIEVGNTDAEGRIVMADALTFACESKPDMIIDYATLTGASVVALGEIAAALYTDDDAIASGLEQASKNTYELLWRMPFWSEYDQMIESKIADVNNVGPRWAGGITAGKFLSHFVKEEIPWAHLDIAGPAIKHKNNSYSEKYNTGYGVRLTIDFLKNLAK